MRKRPIVAIDGPAGVGKSTAAKGIAVKLGFAYIDTGAIYRAVAFLADREGVSWDVGGDLARMIHRHRFSFDSSGTMHLDSERVTNDIRAPRISSGASRVAAHQSVRKALLSIQRVCGKEGGVVLEGRDIGTVVFPDAELKFFLSASPEIRARRRFLELQAQHIGISFEQVLNEQVRRDEADRTRDISPLRKAADAIEIDCGGLTAEQVVEKMLEKIQASFPLTSK